MADQSPSDRSEGRTTSTRLTDQQVWSDDAAASRMGRLARQIGEELAGVHSPTRREDLHRWVEKTIREVSAQHYRGRGTDQPLPDGSS